MEIHSMLLLSFGLAFVSSVFLTFSLKQIAPKIGLMDYPQASNHKTHKSPAAIVGGISIFISFCFTLLFINLPITQLRPLLAASVLLVVIGVLDDLHELSPTKRFVSQILACCIMIFIGNVCITQLGKLLSDNLLELSFFAIPFTIFAVVGVINAFNMSDGMDGQSGVLSGCVLLVLIVLAFIQGDMIGSAILIALLGAVCGFLVFNLRWQGNKPASVFMGDSGSMFIGLVISWYLIHLSQDNDAVIKPITAVWIFALPICDTVVVMFHRIRQRRSPLMADNTHYHHLLQLRGIKISNILALLMFTTLGFGTIAFLIQNIDGIEKYMFYTYLLVVFLYYRWVLTQLPKNH